MICEIADLAQSFNFFWIWSVIVVSTALLTMVMSGIVFQKFYANVSFDNWKRKSNPKFPPPVAIRNEIITSLKGLFAAAICPALSIYLAKSGISKAYCGVGEFGSLYLIATFVLVVVVSDFFEVRFSVYLILERFHKNP